MPVMILFIQTLLPEPVVPAISKCGIEARSETSASPEEALPKNSGISILCGLPPASSIIFFIRTFSFSLFGTSMPIVCLPGKGATTRTAPTPSARAISFASALIWLTLTPAASSSSNIVTTGPVSAATTRALILNSDSRVSKAVAFALTTFSCTAAKQYSGSANNSNGGSS
ncbi:hypothetical protein ES703_49306 [subsurface metagenome]